MARTRTRGGARSGRSGRANKAHALTPAIEFFTRPEQHTVWRVLGFLVRARAELFIATLVVVVFLWLQAWVATWMAPAPEDTPPVAETGAPTPLDEQPLMFGPSHVALLIMLGGVAVLLVIPASRRAITRRVWCVITRHRMRSCFVQSRTMTLDGRLPFLLWSRPSPVGERVRVWLPAGLSVKDIEDDAQRLAAACWAHEARVTPTRHQAALVVVDIVRRDPLGTKTVLEPTVLDTINDEHDNTTGDGTVVPLPDRASLPQAAPAEFPTVHAARNGTRANGASSRNPGRTPVTTPARRHNDGAEDDSEPTVTGFGGVDVSDYV
jgi:hypothetical protein